MATSLWPWTWTDRPRSTGLPLVVWSWKRDEPLNSGKWFLTDEVSGVILASLSTDAAAAAAVSQRPKSCEILRTFLADDEDVERDRFSAPRRLLTAGGGGILINWTSPLLGVVVVLPLEVIDDGVWTRLGLLENLDEVPGLDVDPLKFELEQLKSWWPAHELFDLEKEEMVVCREMVGVVKMPEEERTDVWSPCLWGLRCLRLAMAIVW